MVSTGRPIKIPILTGTSLITFRASSYFGSHFIVPKIVIYVNSECFPSVLSRIFHV